MSTRALQPLVATLFVAVLAGAAGSAVDLTPYSRWRDVFWPIVAGHLETSAALALVGVVGWSLLAGWLRGKLGALAGWVALVAFVPVALELLININKALLPGKFEPTSLIANAAFGLVCLALGAVLRAWLGKSADGERVTPLSIVPGLVCAVLIAGPVIKARIDRSDEPDVIVILLDVLRADHLGCYGYELPTSPNIDAFAENAVLFEKPISSSTFTKTSVASLFTGLAPHNHGVYKGNLDDTQSTITSDVLESRHDTLAELMFAQGLHTEAWVQNGQLRDYMGFAQGFSLYHDQVGSGYHISRDHNRWLQSPASRVRSFTYLHLLDLHAPYNPMNPYWGMFLPKAKGLEAMGYGDWHDFKVKVTKKEIVLEEEDFDMLRARYDECVATVDHWVGEILDNLRKAGRYDNSLIIITGDHGDAFGEHGVISHSKYPYDELVHVPLIVKLPGSAHAGRRISQMVALVDVAPTLLEFVGAPAPLNMDGKSLMEVLENLDATFPHREVSIEYQETMGIRTHRWKYVHRPGTKPHLFDLLADPEEKVNLIEEHPDIAAELALKVLRAREIREARGEVEQVEIDAKTIEELKAIGYM